MSAASRHEASQRDAGARRRVLDVFIGRGFTGQIVSTLGRWRRRAFVAGTAAIAVVASGVAIVSSAAPAAADTFCGIGTYLDCGTPPPLLYLQGMFAATPTETAALQDLENQAVTQTISDHGLDAGDSNAVLTWGRDVAESELWSLIVAAVKANPRTATQQSVVDWLQDVERQYGIQAAYETGYEYALWAGIGIANYNSVYADGTATEQQLESFLSTTPEPYSDGGSADNPNLSTDGGYCVFRAPSPYEGDYNSDYNSPTPPQTCFVPCALCTPPTPSYQDFLNWGDARESGGLFNSTEFAQLSKDITQLSILGGASAVGAGVGVGISQSMGALFATSALQKALFPFAARSFSQAASGGFELVTTAAEAAEIGGELTASAVGAIVSIAIAAVTTAVLEGINVVNAKNLPGQIANLIANAPSANPDVNGMLNDSTSGQSLYSLFVTATMSPVDTNNSTATGLVACDGKNPTCDAPQIPAAGSSDPVFNVTAKGASTPTVESSISWHDGTGGTPQTDSARLSGSWFVEQVTPAGGSPTTFQTLRVHYLDWSNVEQTAWLVRSTDSSTGAVTYEFEGVPDSWQNPSTTFDPSTCVADKTCWTADSIDYSAPDGMQYSASVANDAPIINSLSYDLNPTEGKAATYSVDATSPDGLPLSYDWLFQSTSNPIAYCGSSITHPVFSCSPNFTGERVGVRAGYVWQASGVFLVQLIVTDSTGRSTSKEFQVVVQGVAPVATLGTACNPFVYVPPCDEHTGNIGDTMTVSSTLVVGGVDDHGDTVTVDWGDGAVITSPVGPYSAQVVPFSVSHEYTKAGLFTVTIKFSDTNGDSTSQVTTTETINGTSDVQLYDVNTPLPATIAYGGTGPVVTAVGAASGQPITLAVSTPDTCALGAPTTTTSPDGTEVAFANLYPRNAGVCTVTANQPGTAYWSPGSASASMTVVPAALTITPQATSMNYGHAAPAISATYTGLVNGDSDNVVTGLSCVASDGDGNPVGPTTPPGTYPISCSGATAANYTITYSLGAQLTVGPPLVAPAVTSAASTTFVVGASHAFTVTTNGNPVPSLSVSGTLPTGVTFVDDGDGTAALSGTPDTGSEGAYPITVSATNGLQTATQTFVVTVTGGTASPTTGVLTGEVTDSGGDPVPNACVYLYADGSSSSAAYGTCARPNGSWEIDGVAAGSYNIAFVDPSAAHATQWYTGSAGGAPDQPEAASVTVVAGQDVNGLDAELASVPTGNIKGTAIEANSGTLLANICVYLYPHGNSAAASYATCTTSNGTYEIDGVTAGSYDVAFADPSAAHVTQWHTGADGGAVDQAGAVAVTVPNGGATLSGVDAVMALTPSGNVSGTVSSAGSGTPLANICVYLYPHGNSAAASYATCTGSDGSYRLRDVAAGSYDVAFYAPAGNDATQWYTGSAGGAADQADAVALTVSGGDHTVSGVNAAMAQVQQGIVAGVVTASDTGDPLASVCVYLYPHGSSAAASYATCTGSDGSYQLTGVATGSYDVAFADPSSGYVTQWYTGSAGGATDQASAHAVSVPVGNQTVSDIDAALNPVGSGNVSGSVTDANSAPLANVCVYLYPHGNSAAASYATCTSSDGAFRIPNVAPGFYDVAFYDPSGGQVTQWYTGSAGGSSDQADASPISVTDGNRTVSDVDATMAQVQSGNITGTVTAAATGDPLANVCVYLYRAGTSSSAAYATCTPADGGYAIYGLAPGSYDVAFYDPSTTYETQWYDGNPDGAPDQADATEVTVPAGNQTASGIDAVMAAPAA